MSDKKLKSRTSKHFANASSSPQTTSLSEPIAKQRKRKDSGSAHHQPSDRDPRKKLVHLINRTNHLIPLLSSSLCALPQSRSKVTDLLSHLREAVTEAFAIAISNSAPELRDNFTELQVSYNNASDAFTTRILSSSNYVSIPEPTCQTTCDAPVSQLIQLLVSSGHFPRYLVRIVFTALVHSFNAKIVENLREAFGKEGERLVDEAQANLENADDEHNSSDSEMDPDSSDQPLESMDTDPVNEESEVVGDVETGDRSQSGEDHADEDEDEDKELPGAEDVAAMFSSVGDRALERREKAIRREQLQLFRRRAVGLLQTTLRYTLNGELLSSALQTAVWLACKLRGTGSGSASVSSSGSASSKTRRSSDLLESARDALAALDARKVNELSRVRREQSGTDASELALRTLEYVAGELSAAGATESLPQATLASIARGLALLFRAICPHQTSNQSASGGAESHSPTVNHIREKAFAFASSRLEYCLLCALLLC